ncbi:hypothetical protein EYW49_21210 [Siculibacillus lacustris]|uniref:RDD domain-containing protein n=1 Tax=Siculibacillus lacustris TaxID=1549641 RepID=A0A4Q9VDV5_9HYPH|nr:RDD family protein [Siculibacillus lacustris]TBW32914.1 hypothetical protein EYW49_21210 [Siculibacillus lacustris]
MNVLFEESVAFADLLRAGVWRRFWAFVLDDLVVLVPISVLAAALYAVTAGHVQMGGVVERTCVRPPAISQVLTSPPPRDSNFAMVCRESFFGFPTASELVVGRTTKTGTHTETFERHYRLDADGRVADVVTLDWVTAIVLIAYLMLSVARTGRTIGGRVLGIRVIDTSGADAVAVPFKRVFLRYLFMGIGIAPLIGFVVVSLALNPIGEDGALWSGFWSWFSLGAGVALIWCLVLTVQIARKRDPIYDCLAGTAVVRV